MARAPDTAADEGTLRLPPPVTVLLVGDRAEARLTTKWFLSQFGYQVHSARAPKEALALFDSTSFDVVVTDNSMPGMTGSEMAHCIKARSPSTAVIMQTTTPPEDLSFLDLVLQKPTHLLALKEALDSLLPSVAKIGHSGAVSPASPLRPNLPATSSGPRRLGRGLR